MKRHKNHINNEKIMWSVFLILMFLKYGFFSFRYFPIIDDWIQYGTFPIIPNVWHNVIIKAGYYATRPLATFSDIYIWGQFWGNMGIVLAIMTFLHFLSGCLLYKTLKNNYLPVGVIFLIIYGLLPLGSEATYWISASSRLIVGMFFMSIAFYYLTLYIQTDSAQKRPFYLCIFVFSHLFSMCYYEQIILLSFFGALMIIIANWKNLRSKFTITLPFISFIIILAYYKFFAEIGQVAVRGRFIKNNFIEHFTLVSKEIGEIWTVIHFPLYTNGLKRGLQLLIDNSLLYVALIIFTSVLTAYIAYNEKRESLKNNLIKIGIGILLFLIPFGLFIVLQDWYISIRNTFPSFIGLALVINGLLNLINFNITGKLVSAFLTFSLTLIFLVVNISENMDYKNASEIDYKICSNVITASKDTGLLEGAKSALVFNAKPYFTEQNMHFHQHINNVTESDWAFTGAVRAISRNVKILSIYPIRNSQKIENLNEIITEQVLLGIDDKLNVVKLKAIKKSDNLFLLTNENDYIFGKIENNIFIKTY